MRRPLNDPAVGGFQQAVHQQDGRPLQFQFGLVRAVRNAEHREDVPVAGGDVVHLDGVAVPLDDVRLRIQTKIQNNTNYAPAARLSAHNRRDGAVYASRSFVDVDSLQIAERLAVALIISASLICERFEELVERSLVCVRVTRGGRTTQKLYRMVVEIEQGLRFIAVDASRHDFIQSQRGAEHVKHQNQRT